MRAALDTNILAYAEGVNGAAMKRAAQELVSKLPEDAVLLPVQTLGELFSVLVRKARWSPAKARKAVLNWTDAFSLIDTSAAIVLAAMDLATDHQLGMWDSVIISAAADAGCRLLLSEDLQDGFTWRGVTVTNPFSTPTNELLASLISQAGAS